MPSKEALLWRFPESASLTKVREKKPKVHQIWWGRKKKEIDALLYTRVGKAYNWNLCLRLFTSLHSLGITITRSTEVIESHETRDSNIIFLNPMKQFFFDFREYKTCWCQQCSVHNLKVEKNAQFQCKEAVMGEGLMVLLALTETGQLFHRQSTAVDLYYILIIWAQLQDQTFLLPSWPIWGGDISQGRQWLRTGHDAVTRWNRDSQMKLGINALKDFGVFLTSLTRSLKGL